MLVTVGLTKAFAGNVVLRDVDLEVRAAEIHGLVGENGAGKSTLINLVDLECCSQTPARSRSTAPSSIT